MKKKIFKKDGEGKVIYSINNILKMNIFDYTRHFSSTKDKFLPCFNKGGLELFIDGFYKMLVGLWTVTLFILLFISQLFFIPYILTLISAYIDIRKIKKQNKNKHYEN